MNNDKDVSIFRNISAIFKTFDYVMLKIDPINLNQLPDDLL